MGSTPGTASFFSFGKNDSFISKSFVGVKSRNLPPTLQTLFTSRTVSDVHWAALGPTKDSWVLSFKDSSNKTSLQWGDGISQRLQTVLARTWHSPHLRVFLGPNDSFIVWHPELIRWANLSPKLEDALQSWLTPSGWRVGPPRIVTWGPGGAFFAMSEYGTVTYGVGDREPWEIYEETMEEWKADEAFHWGNLAFITLDPTSSDQFIAIRNDGTWAGSIDDVNEDALETFALNYFARAKSKHKAKPSTSQPNGEIPDRTGSFSDTNPDRATQALYEKWSTETAVVFASASAAIGGSKPKTPRKLQVRSQSSNQVPPATPSIASTPAKLLTAFPYLPSKITTCALTACVILKADPDGIYACQHDVEKLLKASGLYSYEWLRQERLRWHPDRFGRLCDEAWRELGKKMSGEMFKILSALIEEIRKHDGGEIGNAA